MQMIQPTNEIKLPASAQARFQTLFDNWSYCMAARHSEKAIALSGRALERFMERHGIEGFKPARSAWDRDGAGTN